jgi:hypothetical protein
VDIHVPDQETGSSVFEGVGAVVMEHFFQFGAVIARFAKYCLNIVGVTGCKKQNRKE